MKQNSIGAMDCYVMVQESGIRLTATAVLPLIVQVMKCTVLPPVMATPPPCTGDAISVGVQSIGAMEWIRIR
eukprot:5706465-Prymnesium_polylepis.1